MDAVENARELLVGSFDLYLGGAAHKSNEVMKALTVLSAGCCRARSSQASWA